MASILQTPEAKQLYDVARQYLSGRASILDLNAAVAELRDLNKHTDTAATINAELDEWSEMINRRSNEWGLAKEPLMEPPFAQWLADQLALISIEQ